MKVINPSIEVLTPINEHEILAHIELCARNCYKSEDKITPESAIKIFNMLIDKGHMSMLEHYTISVRIICDRGVSHELVRHRLASYAQESTRYCNYSNEMSFIKPGFLVDDLHNDLKKLDIWLETMYYIEKQYNALIQLGATPEEARSVLPNSLKTEVIMTANIREWMHFFDLRYVGTTGKPHPQMKEVAHAILGSFRSVMPNMFKKYNNYFIKEDE
jgi:thymidylate synthase (FAD)